MYWINTNKIYSNDSIHLHLQSFLNKNHSRFKFNSTIEADLIKYAIIKANDISNLNFRIDNEYFEPLAKQGNASYMLLFFVKWSKQYHTRSLYNHWECIRNIPIQWCKCITKLDETKYTNLNISTCKSLKCSIWIEMKILFPSFQVFA